MQRMNPELTLMIIYGGGSFALAAVVGSFLNVCILRLPYDRSLIPPSACPSCNTRLGVLELLPIFGWLLLRGKCKHCHTSISQIYPLVELLTGLLGYLLFRRFVTDTSDLTWTTGLGWTVYFFFFCCLIVMAFVDIRHHIIPDQTSSYALPVGILGILALNALEYTAWPVPSTTQALGGIALGGGSLGLLALVMSFILKREAIGWGDVKALAMLGCFLGAIPGIWSILFIASTLSAIFGIFHLLLFKRRDYLPFAPSLAFSAMAHVLYGDIYLPLFFPTMMTL